MTLEEYKKHIELISTSGQSSVFYNSSKEHAAIVMGSIFKQAKSKVRIWAGDLNGDVSSNDYYINELNDFFDRDGKVEIILDENPDKINPRLKILLYIQKIINSESVTIKQTDVRLKMQNENEEPYSHVHFTVGDNHMYRLEVLPKKYIAKGNFFDTQTTQDLIKVFDRIFEKSPEIKLDIKKK